MDVPKVTVRAGVEREVQPDSFVLSVAVSAVDSEARAATETLIGRFAELERAVAALPDSVEVRPQELSTWPEGGRGRPRWRVRRGMTLVGRDVSLVAEVATAVAGATDDVELDGPRWQLDRDNPVHGELQADAVRQARERAERYAAALGGTLGRLLELSDPEGGHWYDGHAMALASAGATGGPDFAALDLSPQPVAVHASVNASWSLLLPG